MLVIEANPRPSVPLGFAAASAILGTQSVVQGKCASTVLSQSEELTAPALFFLGCSLVVLAPWKRRIAEHDGCSPKDSNRTAIQHPACKQGNE